MQDRCFIEDLEMWRAWRRIDAGKVRYTLLGIVHERLSHFYVHKMMHLDLCRSASQLF
jgi:hypothetical protein